MQAVRCLTREGLSARLADARRPSESGSRRFRGYHMTVYRWQ